MSKYQYELGAIVALCTSVPAILAQERNSRPQPDANGMALLEYAAPIEWGVVVGRAEYDHSQPQYFVRYRGGDGRQVRDWFPAEELVSYDPEACAVHRDDEATIRPRASVDMGGVQQDRPAAPEVAAKADEYAHPPEPIRIFQSWPTGVSRTIDNPFF